MGDIGDRISAWDQSFCFGCAKDNSHGLHVVFEPGTDGTGTAEFRPRPEHEGPPGHLHGGLSATALDEAMGWTAHETAAERWVTGRLEIRYRQPVPLDGGPYRIEIETVKASGRRKTLSARLFLADGTVAVEGQSIFVRV